MKATSLVSIPIILLTFSCLFPSSALAKRCNIDPDQIDYKGPYAVLFSKDNPNWTNLDCSYPPDGSNLDLDVIYNGRLTSQLVPVSAITHGDSNKIIPNGDGTLNLTLTDLSTFGIGGDILSRLGDDGTPNQIKLMKYQKNIEAYKNYDITHLYREAYADNVFTFEDFESWACERGLCICNGDDCHINPSIYSNTSQLTPLKDQLQELLDTAKEIIRCNDSAYADTHKCSTFYPLPGGNSFTIANLVEQRLDPDDLMGSWNTFDDKLKFQTFSLHLTQSAPTFILLVPQKPTCNTVACIVQQFFNPDKPGYIKAVIPEAQTFRNGVITANNQMSPLKDQTQQKLNYGTSYSPNTAIGGNSLLATLLTVAKQKDPNCNLYPPPQLHENLGASATPVKNTSFLSIIHNFFTSQTTTEAQQDKQYCVYIFSPPDLADADTALSASDNSIIRKLMPLKTTGFDVKIDAPQAFESSGRGQTTNNPSGCLEYGVDQNGSRVCLRWDENYIEYQGGSNNANQPAGQLPMVTKNLTFGIARPLKDTIPPNQCLVPWLNNQAVAEGFQLSTTLNADQYNNTVCPNPIKPKSSPSGNYACSGTMGIPLSGASGSCKLCNLERFPYGASSIPPKMIEVIESAAQENGVPASIILAIMAAEGGFERPCYNPTQNGAWTDDMVCADEIPNCNNCNVSPAGAKGPFQVMEYWFPPDKFGSACNFVDAARTVARNHQTESDGNPMWSDQSCGRWEYNQGTKTHTSCADWSEKDVATAARAFRGLCDPQYIQTVVDYWKNFTCGQ